MCLKILIQLQPHEPRYRLQLTRTCGQLAQLDYQLGDEEGWEAALRRSHVVMDDVVSRFGKEPRLVQFLTISQNQLAHCLKTRGRVDEAEELFRAAFKHRQAFVDADPENLRMTRQLASSNRNLAWLLAYWRPADQRDLEQARRHAEQATELDPEAPDLWTCLAYVRYAQGDFESVDQVLAELELGSDCRAEQLDVDTMLALCEKLRKRVED